MKEQIIKNVEANKQLMVDAAAAKDIIASYKPTYSSIKEYFEAINELILDKEAVIYDDKGNATVDFQ